METIYEEVLARNFTQPEYVMHLFNNILTSEMIFYALWFNVKKIWDLREDLKTNYVIEAATTKYNTMVVQKLWKESNPKDTKCMALNTKIEALELAFSTNYIKPKGPNTSNKRNPPEWKVTKKVYTMTHDSIPFYWCPHHKYEKEGKLNKMCMPHKPEEHNT